MATPLVILAVILALFALVLIPFMMAKGGRHQGRDRQQSHGKQGIKHNKKKKKVRKK